MEILNHGERAIEAGVRRHSNLDGQGRARGQQRGRWGDIGTGQPVGDEWVADVPLHGQPVGLQAGVQPVAHDPVEVRGVLASHGSEPAYIQASIAGFQGIVGPDHQVEPLVQHQLALPTLHRVPDVAAAPSGKDAEQVGTMDGGATLQSGEAEQDSHTAPLGVAGHQQQATIAAMGEQYMAGHHLKVGTLPDSALQSLELLDLLRTGQFLDRQRRRSRVHRRHARGLLWFADPIRAPSLSACALPSRAHSVPHPLRGYPASMYLQTPGRTTAPCGVQYGTAERSAGRMPWPGVKWRGTLLLCAVE